MASLANLLRQNRNYRRLWIGQVVSEVGDYFNAVAVLALIMEKTGSGLIVSLVFLSRAIPMVLAAPFAGVLLDRLERRHIMIASDLARGVIAIVFLLTVDDTRPWLLYVLSALLSFATPFFTSGRSSLLPSIASPDELHSANALTQTTGWATLSVGALLGGVGAAKLGYSGAFIFNSLSYVFSAWCIWRITPAARPAAGAPKRKRRGGMREYLDGLAYIKSVPLLLGIGMISIGWAIGGGAAQILFALFGTKVFPHGSIGIGDMWGFAGIGLLIGGTIGHTAGKRAEFARYKRIVAASYIVHGGAYMAFSQAGTFGLALALILLSRIGMAVSSVMNTTQILRHTPDEYLGRTFATMESLRNSVMVFSVWGAGVASQYMGPRPIALVAGGCGMLTAVVWFLQDLAGRLPEPQPCHTEQKASS